MSATATAPATVPQGFNNGEMVLFRTAGRSRGLVVWCVRHNGSALDGTATVVCFGRKRHYRKGGGCWHVEQFMAQVLPEIRAATKVVGWGGEREER